MTIREKLKEQQKRYGTRKEIRHASEKVPYQDNQNDKMIVFAKGTDNDNAVEQRIHWDVTEIKGAIGLRENITTKWVKTTALPSTDPLNYGHILRYHKKLKGETGYKLKLNVVVEDGLDIKHDVRKETNGSTKSNVIMETAQKLTD